MKQLAVALLLCFGASCSRTEEILPALVGHWRYVNDERVCDLTFENDGSFSGRIEEGSQVVWRYAGKWHVDRGSIYYLYTFSSLERIPAGSVDQDRIVEVSDDFYMIEGRQHIMRKYYRVGGKKEK
jgi:hypothetical protein